MVMDKFRKNENLIRIIAAIISILGFLVIWYFSTKGTRLGRILPGPIEIIQKFFVSLTNKVGPYTVLGHALVSLTRVGIGYIIAMTSGIILGLLMGRYRLVEALFRPLYEIVRPLPPIAWISMAILWFGLGEPMKYFMIFIAAFNSITVNVFNGYKAVDQELIGAAKMLGASERQVFWTIIIPGTVPYIFAGAQIAVSASWAAVVAAEMVRSSEGLGWMVISGMDVNDIPQILVGVMAIGIIGFLLATGMRAVEAKLCEWNIRGV
jgi:ABC-type nitrate/sulfonate/bicarbonate transport system permease component